MIWLFFLAFAAGLVLLVVLPHHKNRLHRTMSRGGAAVLFGVGLFGGRVAVRCLKAGKTTGRIPSPCAARSLPFELSAI